MTPEQFIDESAVEIEDYISSIEYDMDALATEYLTTFKYENGNLVNGASNYEKSNSSNKIFDDAFDTFIGAFLLFLGHKILKGSEVAVSDMESRGIMGDGYEKKLTEKMIGFVDDKVVRGGYLWNLGKMSSLRQTFHDYVIRSISATQKLNLFLRDAKPLFVSTEKKRSSFSNYYMKYAFDSVNQATNSISLYIADKRGLTHFLYEGSLVKDSRPFCKEYAGQILTRKDAAYFNTINWKGKIQDADFLIVAGGWNCKHVIKWLPNE
jgi:hypothetical protein